MKKQLNLLLITFSLLLVLPVFAGGVYQQPDDFINQVFDNKPPKAEIIWLKEDLKEQIVEILDHKYKSLRIRYWRQGKISAWILEEIGKEKPITVGIVINNAKIELVKVLAFRESRGWEIRHDFFTSQFNQATLKHDHQLDKNIDNISGATLSVRAVTKLSRIALLLDKKIHSNLEKNRPNHDQDPS